jgi:hypothetical protein
MLKVTQSVGLPDIERRNQVHMRAQIAFPTPDRTLQAKKPEKIDGAERRASKLIGSTITAIHSRSSPIEVFNLWKTRQNVLSGQHTKKYLVW